MSSRFKIQDATNIVAQTENSSFGAFIMKADTTADIPADGGSGYAPGCLLFNFQTGTLYINNGSATSCAFDPFLAGSNFGTIWLPIENFRAIASNDIPALAGTPASGILASDTAPKFKRANTNTDIALKLEWAATSVIEVQGPSILIPPDFDTTKTSTVNVIAQMGGAADTPTLTVKCFPGVGGTDAGGATGALSSSLATVSATIAANTFSSTFPTFANIGLTPGTHGTDVVRVYGVYVRYTRKAVTS